MASDHRTPPTTTASQAFHLDQAGGVTLPAVAPSAVGQQTGSSMTALALSRHGKGGRGVRWTRLAERALMHAVLLAGAALVTFPFLWMLSTSVKTLQESFKTPPTIVPEQWVFENYRLAWEAAPFARYFANTVLIAVAVTALVLVTSTLAAYAFARLRFFGRDAFFVIFLATLMIPGEVTLIPNFVIVRTLGWYDTYLALIVPWGASVFAIFLLRQFFLAIPSELWEASQLDGASHLTYLLRVVVPLSVPPLITVGLSSFLGSWNSFLWPLIFTSRPDVRPIQVALSVFSNEHGTEYHLLMAASTFTVAPILVLFLFVQRHFIEGIARTGLRG